MVNAPEDFHLQGGFALRGDLFHDRPQCVHVADGQAVHFDNKVADLKAPQLGPTTRSDLVDQCPLLVSVPLLIDSVEEGDVAGGELEVIVAVLFHLALQSRRAFQFNGDLQRLEIAQHG